MGTSHRMLNVHHASIVIVGDACVGKTSLVKMFHSDGRTYPKDYMMASRLDSYFFKGNGMLIINPM